MAPNGSYESRKAAAFPAEVGNYELDCFET